MTLQFVYFTVNGLQLEVGFPKVDIFQKCDTKKYQIFIHKNFINLPFL